MSNKKGKSVKIKLKIIDGIDKPLLIATIILICFGILSIVSASANESISRYGKSSVYYYFYRHIIMVGIGLFLTVIVHRFKTIWYRILAPVLFITITGVLIALFIYASAHRGALNWITIGGVKFQPSELSKPIIVLMIAMFFEFYNLVLKDKPNTGWLYTALWVVIGMVIPIIVFLQDDLGTALIIASISGFMYLAGPLNGKEKFKHILILLGCFIVCLSMFGMVKGYIFTDEQKERLTMFFNPCSNYEDSGYQICNGFIAMNDGGLTGLGIGKSKQKYSYIPEAYTDSIFAIIIEEDGLIVGLLVLILYCFMICRIINISRKAITTRGRYIAFGVAVYFITHIIFNLGGLFGILPLTGVPLPLISYGGTFTISFLVALALVQRVSYETSQRKPKPTRI